LSVDILDNKLDILFSSLHSSFLHTSIASDNKCLDVSAKMSFTLRLLWIPASRLNFHLIWKPFGVNLFFIHFCKNRISNLLSNMSTDKSSYMNDTIESIFREQTKKLTFTKKRKFANLEKKTRKWSSTNKEYTKSKNSNVKHLEPEEIVNVVGDRNCFFRYFRIRCIRLNTPVGFTHVH
jgi:hypothetical protein